MTEPVGIDAQAIHRRAHELWLKRGCPTGSPELDWQQAERELSAEAARSPSPVAPSSPARDPQGEARPQPPRPRAPRTFVTRTAHAPAARLLAALVPEAGLGLARASSRR